MSDYDIHSCGYFCDRPACILRQRNELRDKLFEGQAVKTYSGGKPNYTEPEEILTHEKNIQTLDRQAAESARPWVGLTDAELGELYHAGWSTNMDFARGIQRALKEKNT